MKHLVTMLFGAALCAQAATPVEIHGALKASGSSIVGHATRLIVHPTASSDGELAGTLIVPCLIPRLNITGESSRSPVDVSHICACAPSVEPWACST